VAKKSSNPLRGKIEKLKEILDRPRAPKDQARESRQSASAKTEGSQAGAAETPDREPEKKKSKPQPWYRHRQRW
jgi:hypothetical protein